MNDLKPCPFCKADAEVNEMGRGLFKIVARHDEKCCFYNLAWIIGYESEEEAIEAWNRRASNEG